MSKSFKLVSGLAIFVLIIIGGFLYFSKGNLFSSADLRLPYNSRVFGKVVDQDQKPIAGVKVSIVVNADAKVYLKTKTDSFGAYSFTVRGPINFSLEFKHDEYYSSSRSDIYVPADTQYEVTPAQILQKRGTGGAVEGYIKNQLGIPVVDAWVTISNDSFFDQAKTLPDGYYSDDLPVGYFKMEVGHYAMDHDNPGQNEATISVRKGQTVRQDFQINLKLAGSRE